MDTKRCLRCHKLLRADAQKCSLCGYLFLQMPVRRNSKTTNGSRYSATASFPSNSPASPHRAGHYSGLHPEDQPYQSSFMPILRPAAITRRLNEPESKEMLESIAVSSVSSQDVHEAERKQTSKRYVASPVPIPLPMPQRSPGVLSQKATPSSLLEVNPYQLVPESTLHEQITAQLPLHVTDKRQRRGPLIRILFIAAILSFLVASSILTYLIVFTRTGAPLYPTAKVVHAGSQQRQFSVPQLQLSAMHIDFGAVNVQNSLTLTNTGDQQVNWQAGVESRSSWLGISPTFGTFSKKETATVMVNRSNLAPQAYTGYIHFFQQGTNNPLTLEVTMRVTAPSATVTVSPHPVPTVGSSPLPAIVITTNALTFNAIRGKNPASQTFTLTNPGNAPLNWAITGDATATTSLSISPESGTVASGSSIPISVTPNVHTSIASVINATLTIQDTNKVTRVKSQKVAVKIIISSNQALISVTPAKIACKLSSTVSSCTQQLQITNSGSATLNWAISSQSLPAWISVDTTSGALPPGYIAFVNITCNNAALQAGRYTYTLVVSDTDAQTPITAQNVQVTLTVT
jgi:Viral BACON domain